MGLETTTTLVVSQSTGGEKTESIGSLSKPPGSEVPGVQSKGLGVERESPTLSERQSA